MAKSGNKNTTKASKDKIKEKSGTGAIVKAKEKRKKAVSKKIKEKLEDEIQTANVEFSELQSKLITEKENEKMENEKMENEISKEKDLPKASVSSPAVSQEKKVEDTTNVLANL